MALIWIQFWIRIILASAIIHVPLVVFGLCLYIYFLPALSLFILLPSQARVSTIPLKSSYHTFLLTRLYLDYHVLIIPSRYFY